MKTKEEKIETGDVYIAKGKKQIFFVLDVKENDVIFWMSDFNNRSNISSLPINVFLHNCYKKTKYNYFSFADEIKALHYNFIDMANKILAEE